jgi:1-acyl-sn-glycerol-3-phosphate acyltransferase
VSATVKQLPVYGVDADATQQTDVVDFLRRRFDGRYAIDPFGADPQLQDLVSPLFTAGLRVQVHGAEHLPRSGPALLVANRGFGVLEPTVLALAMRQEVGRRLRVVGAPDLPVVGDLVRKLGGIMSYPDDLAALLRAGHVAAAPLGPTWLRTGAGTPPTPLLVAALGYPVVPVSVRPGGPFGLALRPWQVRVGEPLEAPAARGSREMLAGAELAEAARDAVQALIDRDRAGA